MKMVEFLERLPESFAQEILTALPGPDRKDLLRSHGAKVKVTAGNLKRSVRAAKRRSGQKMGFAHGDKGRCNGRERN